MLGVELDSCTLEADTQGSLGTQQPDAPQPGSAAKAPEQQQQRGSSAAAPEQQQQQQQQHQQQQRGSSTAKAPEEQPSSAAAAGAPDAEGALNSSNRSTEYARFRRRCSAKRFKVQVPDLASRWDSKDKRASLFQDFLQNEEDMAKVELVHKRRVVNQTRARRKILNKTEKDPARVGRCVHALPQESRSTSPARVRAAHLTCKSHCMRVSFAIAASPARVRAHLTCNGFRTNFARPTRAGSFSVLFILGIAWHRVVQIAGARERMSERVRHDELQRNDTSDI